MLQVDSNLTVGWLNMSERPSDVRLAEVPCQYNTIEFVNEASSPKQFKSICLSTFYIVGFCPLFMLWDFVLWDSVLWDFVRRDFVLWDFVLWDSVRIPTSLANQFACIKTIEDRQEIGIASGQSIW